MPATTVGSATTGMQPQQQQQGFYQQQLQVPQATTPSSVTATTYIQPPQQQQQQQQQQGLYQQQLQISSSVPAQQHGQYPAMNQYPTASAQPKAYPTNTYNNATYPTALTTSPSGTYITYPAMPPPVQMAVQSPQSPLYPVTNPSVVANHQLPQQYQQQQHGVVSSQPAGISALDTQRRVTLDFT